MPPKIDYGPACKIGGCLKPPDEARGMCSVHYNQWRNVKRGGRALSLWAVDIKPGAIHRRCRILWGRASESSCVECDEPAMDWAYDGTDPTQLYAAAANGTWLWFSRFPEFYMPMCRKCHRVRDGEKQRMELHAYRLSIFTNPQQEFGVVAIGKEPEEQSYAQAVRTVTRSRSSRGERVIHVGRHPGDGRPRNRRRTGRTRAA